MKTYHICINDVFSGLEQYACDTALYQKTKGFDVKFFCQSNSPMVKYLNNQVDIIASKNFLHSLYLQFITLLSLFFKPAPNELTVFHIHTNKDFKRHHLLLLGLRLYKLFKHAHIKVVVQTHIWISHNKKDFYHTLKYKLIDEVWCSSELARIQLNTVIPLPTERIKVINYGRDISAIENHLLDRHQARKHFGYNENDFIIGSVARFDPGKGAYEVSQVAKLFNDQLNEQMKPYLPEGTQIRFLWIGGVTPNNPLAQPLYDETIKMDLPNLQLAGFVPQSSKYLKVFDLFIMASFEECFSLALIEAQVGRIPCLASNSGGSPTLVIPNKTGWLFTPRSVDSLKDAVVAAIKDQKKYMAFTDTAYDYVKNHHDWANCQDDIIQLYKN